MKFDKLLDYIYPPRCPACDAISPQGFCATCRKKLIFIADGYCMKCGKPLEDDRQEYCPDCKKTRHYFDQGRALFSYQGIIKTSLYRFKYANRREYARTYAGEIAANLQDWISQKQITSIVPIPLHASRRRKRGYNQAGLLAHELGRCTGLPVDESLLVRTKRTDVQKTLDPKARIRNLRGAFEVNGSLQRNEHILLIDDIYTTGSTVDQAAIALKKERACLVYVLTVAIGG